MGLLTTTVRAAKKLADEFDEAAWLKENPKPAAASIPKKDRTPEEAAELKKWQDRRNYLRNQEKRKARAAEYRAANRDRVNEQGREYRSRPEYKEQRKKYDQQYAQTEKFKNTQARYRDANSEKVRQGKQRYKDANREEVNRKNREYNARLPLHVKNEKNAKRRAAKLDRTPAYSNNEAIKRVYERAGLLSEATGIPHEVDHVFPLQGKTVSGLHVPGNLMITPQPLNRGKSNSFTPGDDPMRFNDVARQNIEQANEMGLLNYREGGFADPRLLAGTAAGAAGLLAAPQVKDSGFISAPRSEGLFDFTMGARDLERRLEGSPASLLFPTGLVEYLETVNRRTEDPNAMTRGMALLDVLPF